MSSASPNFNDDGSPSCSSSCSSAFRLPPSPMQRGQGRRRHHASPSAPAFGDLATRLEGWDHPDDRVAPDGARLRATKYVRGWRPSRGDFKSERGPARPNVQVPFASEPSAIREFLWGKSFVLFLFNGRASCHSNLRNRRRRRRPPFLLLFHTPTPPPPPTHTHTPSSHTSRPHPRLRRPRRHRERGRHLRPHRARQAPLQGQQQSRPPHGGLLPSAGRRGRPGEARARAGRAGEGPLPRRRAAPRGQGRQNFTDFFFFFFFFFFCCCCCCFCCCCCCVAEVTRTEQRQQQLLLVPAAFFELTTPPAELRRRLDVVATGGGRGRGPEAQAWPPERQERVCGKGFGADRGAQRGAAVCRVEGADWVKRTKKGEKEKKAKRKRKAFF